MNTKLLLAAALSALLLPACEPAAQTSPAIPPQGGGACQPVDCGPLAEIARVCDDGSIGTPTCGRAADGACRWEHVCPAVMPPGGAQPPQPQPPPEGQPAPQQVAPQQAAAPVPAGFAEANTAFAQDLYGRLAATPGNLFFSPVSVSTALAMTYPGSRGETAAELAKTMRFTLPPEQLHAAFAGMMQRLQAGGAGAPEIKIANRLWGQAGMPVEPAFQKTLQDHYGAGIELVDFRTAAEQARGQINTWASEKTNGKITDVLPRGSVNALTRLVLANAIYFKGKWATPFDKASTKAEPFTVKPGTKVQAPMMHRTLRAGYGETADASVLELAYQGAGNDRPLSMVVILPKAIDGLPKVEAGIAAGKLGGYLGAIGSAEVDVALPRFTMTSEHNLSATLAAMGMPLAFDENKADFSGITRAERLYITRVQHKAFVDVGEEGTEAAAVTAVVIGARTASVPMPPKVFRADHPFAFLIRDGATGTVLFMGRVANPSPA